MQSFEDLVSLSASAPFPGSAEPFQSASGHAAEIETVVEDYFRLLKAAYHGDKPRSVALDFADYFVLIVDGVPYDLEALVPSTDAAGTKCKSEIEALLFAADLSFEAVQHRLNHKVQTEW